MSEDTTQFDAAIVRAIEAIEGQQFEDASLHLEEALEARFVPAVAEALAMVDRRRAGEGVDLASVVESLRARPDDEFFGADIVIDESDMSAPPAFEGLEDVVAEPPPDEASTSAFEQTTPGEDGEDDSGFDIPRERDWSQDGLQTAEVAVAAEDPWFDDDDEIVGDEDLELDASDDGFATAPSARYRGVAPPPPRHRTGFADPGSPIFQTAPGRPGSGDWLSTGGSATEEPGAEDDALGHGESAGGQAPTIETPSLPAAPRGEATTAEVEASERATVPFSDEDDTPTDAASAPPDPGATPLPPAPETAGGERALPVASLLERIGLLVRRGDLASALNLCDEVLDTEPGNAAAMAYRRDARERMAMLRIARLEPLDRAPRADLAKAAATAALTPQMMFVLTQADGVATLRDLIDLSGQPRDAASEMLLELYDAGLLVD